MWATLRWNQTPHFFCRFLENQWGTLLGVISLNTWVEIMPAEIGGDHGRSHSIFNSDQFLDLMLKPKSWIFILRISQKILLTLRGESFWCRHCFSLVLQWLIDTFSLPFLDLAYIARSASLKLLTIAFWKQTICFWCYVQNVWTLAFVSNALAHILSGFYRELSI